MLEVIDGQQRILTITIFFAAVRDILKYDIATIDSISYSDEIQNNLIRTGSGRISAHGGDSTDPYRIKVGKDLEDFFRLLIQNSSEDIKKIKPKINTEKRAHEAYSYFRSRVKEILVGPKTTSDKIKLVQRLITKVLGIQYIDIRVGNSETAYNLFESHNASRMLN